MRASVHSTVLAAMLGLVFAGCGTDRAKIAQPAPEGAGQYSTPLQPLGIGPVQGEQAYSSVVEDTVHVVSFMHVRDLGREKSIHYWHSLQVPPGRRVHVEMLPVRERRAGQQQLVGHDEVITLLYPPHETHTLDLDPALRPPLVGGVFYTFMEGDPSTYTWSSYHQHWEWTNTGSDTLVVQYRCKHWWSNRNLSHLWYWIDQREDGNLVGTINVGFNGGGAWTSGWH
jgi:hypothetical protein